MSYPTTGNLAPAFADLSGIAKQCADLNNRACVILNDIRPALLGQRVTRYGRLWEVSQVQVWANGRVTCYGVRVSKKGKVGTRGFSLGMLEDCKFITVGQQPEPKDK